jgi:hypothetical protein
MGELEKLARVEDDPRCHGDVWEVELMAPGAVFALRQRRLDAHRVGLEAFIGHSASQNVTSSNVTRSAIDPVIAGSPCRLLARRRERRMAMETEIESIHAQASLEEPVGV